MLAKNLLHSGWIHALFIAMVSYPLASMTQKFVASYTDINILAYTAVFLLASSVCLLVMAGPGELATATLKRFETWAYAFLQIISYILFLFSVKYATATEGAALAMIGGLFIMIFSFAFLNQKMNRYEVVGSLIMTVGLCWVIYNTSLSLEHKFVLTGIVVLRGLVISFQKIITEVHKTNRKATSFKAQMRVTGFIMAVASFVYLFFLLAMAFLKQHSQLEMLSTFPSFTDFVSFEMFLFSLFVGFIVVSTSKYCEFYAGKTIGARYLTSITSLQIVFVYGVERVLSSMNIITPSEFDFSIIGAVVLILFGNFIISMAGFLKDLKFIEKGEKQDTLANLEDNFLEGEKDFELLKLNLSNLLALYDYDSKKLSKDIKIDRVMLDNIANYELGELKITLSTAKKINDFATQNVATKDKLTKAYNRYYLEHIVKKLFKEDVKFKLYYLDLNRFKPVNDQHGHNAGDFVLQTVVSRLTKIQEFNDHIFRLGGDEFIIIQTEMLEKDFTNDIVRVLEKPILYRTCALEISTSVGVSESTGLHALNEMLEIADKLMLEDKKQHNPR